MKKTMRLIVLLFAGVFGVDTDGVKMMSVMEGDSVTLNTCVNDKIQKDDLILWTFGDSRVALKSKASDVFSLYDGDDGIFRNRLQVDPQTGSLTIRNIRTIHSGLYEAEVISNKARTIRRSFNVIVTGVFDLESDKLKLVSVMEGEPVTLPTSVTVKRNDLILWKFGQATKQCVHNAIHHVPCHSDVTAIAKLDGETREISLDDGEDQIFTDKLRMDRQTGDLTIRNTRTQHTGFYLLQISRNNETLFRRFNVTVSAGTESQQSSVWNPLSIFLLVIVVLMSLVAVVIIWCNKNTVFRKVMSWTCCQSNVREEPDSTETRLNETQS